MDPSIGPGRGYCILYHIMKFGSEVACTKGFQINAVACLKAKRLSLSHRWFQ